MIGNKRKRCKNIKIPGPPAFRGLRFERRVTIKECKARQEFKAKYLPKRVFRLN